MRNFVRRSLIGVAAAALASCTGNSDPQSGGDAGSLLDTGGEGSSDAGVCIAPAVACSGDCVDLDNSSEHCGDCDTRCGQDEQCRGGVCTCSEGLQPCGDACVDTTASAQHCGTCNSPCSDALPICENSVCISGCAENQARCDGECVNTLLSIEHCGQCNNTCTAAASETPICIEGECDTTCAPGFFDIDPAEGCEYACTPTPGRIEVCDGVDNDCNTLVDQADPRMRTSECPLQDGVCAGAQQSCTNGELACDATTYANNALPLRYQVGDESRCDGVDNNCNDQVDEGCCDSPTVPVTLREAAPPAGFVRQVDRQVRGYFDGDSVVIVWERERERADGTLTREVVLGRVAPDGGEPRSPVVLVEDGYSAWDAVVGSTGVDVWYADAEGAVFRELFDLRGTEIGESAFVADLEFARTAEVSAVRVTRTLTGHVVELDATVAGNPLWRLIGLGSDLRLSAEYFESRSAVSIVSRRRAPGIALIRIAQAASQSVESQIFNGSLRLDVTETLFATTTWPGLIDAEFSPLAATDPRILLPSLGATQVLELVTLTDAGVERLVAVDDSAPSSTAVGLDADGNTLIAWSTDGDGDLNDVMIAAVVGATPDGESPPIAVLEQRATFRGLYAMPVDLIEGPERAWVVIETWTADLRTRRMSVYPLSAEGIPLCD